MHFTIPDLILGGAHDNSIAAHMRQLFHLPRSLGGVLLALLSLPSLHAQTNTGIIRGTVIDPTGALIAGAKVTALNAETGLQYTAVNNESGLYSIPDVPAGSYSVTIEHSGFRIGPTGKDEVGNVITAAAVACSAFRPERDEVFRVAPVPHVEATGS